MKKNKTKINISTIRAKVDTSEMNGLVYKYPVDANDNIRNDMYQSLQEWFDSKRGNLAAEYRIEIADFLYTEE